jgi:hypothetical protein
MSALSDGFRYSVLLVIGEHVDRQGTLVSMRRGRCIERVEEGALTSCRGGEGMRGMGVGRRFLDNGHGKGEGVRDMGMGSRSRSRNKLLGSTWKNGIVRTVGAS